MYEGFNLHHSTRAVNIVTPPPFFFFFKITNDNSCVMTANGGEMEEAESIVLFEEAKSHESNSNNLRASELYTEFINQALACPNRQSL